MTHSIIQHDPPHHPTRFAKFSKPSSCTTIAVILHLFEDLSPTIPSSGTDSARLHQKTLHTITICPAPLLNHPWEGIASLRATAMNSAVPAICTGQSSLLIIICSHGKSIRTEPNALVAGCRGKPFLVEWHVSSTRFVRLASMRQVVLGGMACRSWLCVWKLCSLLALHFGSSTDVGGERVSGIVIRPDTSQRQVRT